MVKVTICIGSSCHLKGSRQVVEELQRLVADHQLKDKVELAGQFCMGNCQNGVCVTVDGEQFSLKPESTKQFFEEQIVPRIISTPLAHTPAGTECSVPRPLLVVPGKGV